MAGDVAGLGEVGKASGGGVGGGEVGFGGAEFGADLGDFLRPGARFCGGEEGSGLGGGGFRLGDFFGAEAASELVDARGGFSETGLGLAEAGAEFGKIEANQWGFGIDDGAFLSEDFGDSSSDLRTDFDAAGFDDSVDGKGGRGTVSEPPPADDGGDRKEKERQTAGDHVPKGYSKR